MKVPKRAPTDTKSEYHWPSDMSFLDDTGRHRRNDLGSMCWLRRTKYSFLTFEKTVWDEMIRDERRDDSRRVDKIRDVTKESHWDMGREVPNETLNYEKEERRYEYDIRR